jgi:hypothetical protein
MGLGAMVCGDEARERSSRTSDADSAVAMSEKDRHRGFDCAVLEM